MIAANGPFGWHLETETGSVGGAFTIQRRSLAPDFRGKNRAIVGRFVCHRTDLKHACA
jgi:hypothetical protein